MIQPCPHPTSTAAYRSPLRALFALISASFILMMLAAWMLHRPAPEPGAVEAQIRNFSPDMAPKLAFSQTFVQAEETISGTTQAVSGFRPQTEEPRAPAGLLPVEKQAWEAMAERQKSGTRAQEMVPFFPARYSDGSLVQGKGMAIHLRPLASRGASAVIENGKIVYHEAYRSTDSLQVVAEGQTEEFLLLHDAKAPQRFEYEIATANGVKEITIANEAVHFKNASNQELTLDAPWLIDATGQRVEKGIRWEMHSQADPQAPAILALVVAKGTKLHYPVLIDPSWNNTLGNAIEGRYQHSATLLNNGKVLVMGGSSYNTDLHTAEIYDPATGIWSSTGSLSGKRFGPNSTLLRNGKVLVTGGLGSSTVLSSAELYDPTTGTWASTGNMNSGHFGHTSTLLPNGQVFVASGASDNTGAISSSSELYNPATGTWTLTANIPIAVADATATLLPNGRVLIAGGFSATQAPPKATIHVECQIFNPANGSWQLTGNLKAARRYATATLLPSGKVLVAGGSDQFTFAQKKAELYDPATGVWTLTGSMHFDHTGHTANLLPNGQVVVVAGFNNSTPISNVEIFNPTTGTWINSTSLSLPRGNATTTLLANGQLLAVGGYNDNNLSVSATTELFSPVTTNWLTAPTGTLSSARFAHTSTLLTNGKVLVAGGRLSGVGASLSSAELYDPATALWSATGGMTQGRAYHRAILLPSGKVLALGGYGTTTAINSAELYDPSTGTWKPTGNLITARSNPAATLLANGNVLVAGGNGANGSGPTSKTEIYEPSSGTWRSTGNLIIGEASQTATLLKDGRVLLVGGTDAAAKPQALVQIYSPLLGQWNIATSLSFARAYHTATLLPSGKVLVAGGLNSSNVGLNSTEIYDPATNQWSLGKNLSNARHDHTATLLATGQVWVGGGFTALAGTPLAISELYTPATNTWTTMGPLTAARSQHAATLLLDGSVLITGGYNSSAALSSAERAYRQAFTAPTPQPAITNARRPVQFPGAVVALPGTGYTGISEASGGNSSQNCSSNIPVMQMQSLVNGEVMMLPVDPAKGFSATTFTSLPVTGMPTGHALATVFVNGVPSVSAVVSFSNFAQKITFPALGTPVYKQTIALGVSSDSGLPITYGIVSGPATLNGSNVTFTGLGPVILTANQPGNATTNAAPQVTVTCTVTPAPQTISPFGVIASPTIGDAPFPITLPTSSSGLPVTVTVKSGPATLSGNMITITGAGAVTLAANQVGNGNYLAAPEVTTSFTVNKIAQTITFPALGTQPVGSYALGATASSGLPVTYSASGPAIVSGSTLTITGTGMVTVAAHQFGDAQYAAAPVVKVYVTAIQAAQTITFGAIPDQQFGGNDLLLTATSTSGLPITYTVSGPATLAANQLKFTGAGTVTVTASQAGDANYNAATSVQQSFTVAKGDQTITFGPLPDKQVGAAPFTLTATASSGLAIVYSISGPATLSGNVVTIIGAGQVGISAHQFGNTNYNAAPMVKQKFNVTP